MRADGAQRCYPGVLAIEKTPPVEIVKLIHTHRIFDSKESKDSADTIIKGLFTPIEY